MSTIEKAAARLVRKPVAPTAVETDPEVGSVTPQAPTPVEEVAGASHADQGAATATDGSPQTSVAADAATASADKLAKPSGSETPVAGTIRNRATGDGFTKSCELDFDWLSEIGFLVPGHEDHALSQEFRRVKRPLLLNLQTRIQEKHNRPTNLIYLTSALPNEGKSFVSLNLALCIAGELDKSVLLVDGDAAKGDLSRWLGIHDQPGLVDLLVANNAYAESSIIDTNVDRLSVLSCGHHAANLDELYASNCMSELLNGLASRDANRVVIVDGPPLIPTTEASVLAMHMGQCLMVVEANRTRQTAVTSAAKQLQNCQLVSMVLNKAPGMGALEYGYGYGYGYGYEYEYGGSKH
ncbi:MAG: hypothetical protein AAF529_19775 [Pseudomonadota bacterium]